MTQRREDEAAVHRSMRQASYSRQQMYAHHNQQRHTTQSTHQQSAEQPSNSSYITAVAGNRAIANQPSRQAANGHQYKHPQHISQPHPGKTRLEEKLQGLGAPKKLFGDSVATSELGSLYSAAGVPKTIFHRTSPPSARSTPSSMQNTLDYSRNPAVASNQGTHQRALNTLSRGLTPDLSSQVRQQGRVSSQPGHTTADGFADSNNTLGFIPIGSQSWMLKQDFLDSSPIDPPPRRSPLGFFPASVDEVSQLSDGFGRLNSNKLGSLQVGAETWNLKYDFHDSPASRNDPFDHPPQPPSLERRHHPEPVAPPTVNRHPGRVQSRPPQPVRNDSSNRHPPKKLVMNSVSEIRDGTRVQTLRFVGREDSPSPQQPLPPPTRLPEGKKRFQSVPYAAKMSKSASSPQSQRASHVVNRSNQPQKQIRETERRHNQEPAMKRSLGDKLRSVDPPSSEEKRTFAEASQVSGSVFEAVEVGAFGVQHTLFSKWEKPKDVNHTLVQPYPYQSQPPQRQAPGVHHGRSYVSTFTGRQDPVVAKLGSNPGRFKDRMKAMATKASQKLVLPGGSPNGGGENQKVMKRVYI